MDWESRAIILELHDYDDGVSLMSALTFEHGLRKGVVHGSKTNKQALAVGNVLDVQWRARLEHHLGAFKVQSFDVIAQFIYQDKQKLTALLAACELLKVSLQEKEEQQSLYVQLESFLYALRFNNPLWASMLVILELELLSRVGFGLDLEKCAATGARKNLVYVSPRSGKAVSEEAGQPYKDKLFAMPKLFVDPNVEAQDEDLAAALRVTRYFLMKNVFAGREDQFPSLRTTLEESFGLVIA